MGCTGENTFAAYIDLRLPPAETAALFAHLDQCSDCARLLMAASAGQPSPPRPPLELQPIDASVYEVGHEIARGGMGRIFEAWDRRHHRSVAIKMLLRNEDAAAARFLREIRVASRLEHPTIVPLYEAGIWTNGEPFMAMRLIQGRPLGEVVDAAKTLRDRIALLPHVIELTEALAYAHEQHVVHRDLKPSNVLVGGFGETVVIDWGLAKELDSPEGGGEGASAGNADPNLTATGRAVGTPCYMPPEQARGEPVDARADVYALGALLYHVLSGVPPFQGASPEAVLAKVLAGPPRPLTELVTQVPPELLTIVDKAMARAPEQRYPSAASMAHDLRSYANGQLVSAHRYSIGTLVRRWVANHRVVVATAIAAVLGVGVTAGLSVRRIALESDRRCQAFARAFAFPAAASARAASRAASGPRCSHSEP
jgi:serine/threonine protein kinase